MHRFEDRFKVAVNLLLTDQNLPGGAIIILIIIIIINMIIIG